MSTIIHCPFCKKKINHVHVSVKLIKTQKWVHWCAKCDIRFRFIQPEVGDEK